MSSDRMPHFLRKSCKTQWEAEPKRVMPTLFAFQLGRALDVRPNHESLKAGFKRRSRQHSDRRLSMLRG